ncbi:hypothetical protein DFJ73DRAFT_862136 [Zopfochytrium polystomum]|nr:hypothetical protein DFJ73DRAFT_862136 [Zopfochytrium polystomum]
MIPDEAWAFVGVIGTVVVYTVYDSLLTKPPPPPAIEKKKRGRDALSLNVIADLVKSPSVRLHDSAFQILLDRAISDRHFPQILYYCWDDTDADVKQKAISTIQQLSKNEANRSLLVRWGVLKMLAHVLVMPNTETTYRNAVVTLYRLISNKARRKRVAVKLGVLNPLMRFLTSYPTHSNDLKYWSLLLVHQLSLSESLHPILLEKGLIPILGQMTRLTFGNTNMQKYCLHSLVRLVSNLENQEAELQLKKLMDLNMASMIAACLRNEDTELVSWAVFLMQEFVVKEFARSAFCEVKGIVKILLNLLSSTETCIPRVTLRVLKNLSVRNESFQHDILKAGVLKKTVPLIKSTDLETQFWSLALLHDLLLSFEYHEEFFEIKGLDYLIEVSNAANLALSLYISDIFIFLCGSGRNRQAILKSKLVDSVFLFIKSSETDLQYAGALLLLNLVTFSSSMIDTIMARGGLNYLSKFMTSPRADIEVLAAKALASMARKDTSIRQLILFEVVHLLVSKIVNEGVKRNYDEALGVDLESLHIFLLPHSLGFNEPPIFPDLRLHLDELCDVLIDVCLLPFLGDEGEDDEESDGLLSPATKFSELRENLNESLIRRLQEMEDDDDLMAEVGKEADGLDYSTREILAIRALNAISSMYYLEDARANFERHSLARLMIVLMRSRSKILARQSLMSLSICIHLGMSKTHLAEVPQFIDSILKYILFDGHSISSFYGQLLLDSLADYTPGGTKNYNDGYVEVDVPSMTPYLCLSGARSEVRNESWTFESMRANYGVQGSGKYAYEVLLSTDGILQVGWTTLSIVFDPEGGEGVGDNEHSYAFDGQRMKKWHAYAVSENSYGVEWSSGDTITALLDLDEGTISYYRNGEDLGVAFRGISAKETWYPAVSLASAQGCRMSFGSVLDPISDLPTGYSTIPVSKTLPTPVRDPNEDSSITVRQRMEIGTLVDSSQDWSAPAFYFELTLGLRSDAPNPLPLQFGLYDGATRVYIVTPVPNATVPTLAFVLVQTADPTASPIMASLHDVVSSLLSLEGDEEEAELGDGEVGARVVALAEGAKLCEGDTLGAAFMEEGRVGFTLNGEVLGFVFDAVNGEVLPYFRNVPKYVSNYGNSAFKWYPQ